MTQTLQIIQLVLFILPILTLFGMGGVILLKSVTIINRRWFLLIFLPLLFANPLAILENTLANPSRTVDWRLWLILTADLALAVWLLLSFRGFMVYGLDSNETVELLKDLFQGQGLEVHLQAGKKRLLWGKTWDAKALTIDSQGQKKDIWIIERFHEVLVHTDSKVGLTRLKEILPSLRKIERPYAFKSHAMGVLYLVLGVVLAVLSWIFFFEPRLILIE